MLSGSEAGAVIIRQCIELLELMILGGMKAKPALGNDAGRHRMRMVVGVQTFPLGLAEMDGRGACGNEVHDALAGV